MTVLLVGVIASSAARAAGPSPDPAPSGGPVQSASGPSPDSAPQATESPSAPSTSESNASVGTAQRAVSGVATSAAASISSISPVSSEAVAATVLHRPRTRTSNVSAQPRKTRLSLPPGSAQGLLARELGAAHQRSSPRFGFRSQSVAPSRPDRFLLVLGALALVTLVVASASLLRLLRRMNGSPLDWQVR